MGLFVHVGGAGRTYRWGGLSIQVGRVSSNIFTQAVPFTWSSINE